jgi:septal ring factor EnvC (AmiA/AmiB activator)
MRRDINKYLPKQRAVLIFCFCLVLFTAANGQTIKTDAGKQLDVVENRIKYYQREIDETSKSLDEAKTKLSPEHPFVMALQKNLTELRQTLVTQETEKKGLLTQELVKTLPNSQVELLKMIILQNEKIIGLLEQLEYK